MLCRISAVEMYKTFEKHDLCYSDICELISYLAKKDYDVIQKFLAVNSYIEVSKKEFESILSKLCDKLPVAYITGVKYFYGYPFFVNKDVLIPRSDTEILVSTVLETVELKQDHLIVDLCTGSGCILLSLLKELPDSKGKGFDISERALQTSIKNSINMSLADRADFVKSDILIELDLLLKEPFTIITANPPYIPVEEYRLIDKSVKYEPYEALVASDDGLVFYKKILSSISKLSSIRGRDGTKRFIYMETGYNQAHTVKDMGFAYGLNLNIVEDLGGRPRVVYGDF